MLSGNVLLFQWQINTTNWNERCVNKPNRDTHTHKRVLLSSQCEFEQQQAPERKPLRKKNAPHITHTYFNEPQALVRYLCRLFGFCLSAVYIRCWPFVLVFGMSLQSPSIRKRKHVHHAHMQFDGHPLICFIIAFTSDLGWYKTSNDFGLYCSLFGVLNSTIRHYYCVDHLLQHKHK